MNTPESLVARVHRRELCKHVFDVSESYDDLDLRPIVGALLTLRFLPVLARPDGKRSGKRGRVLDMHTGQLRAARRGEIGERVRLIAGSGRARDLLWSAVQRAGWKGGDL